MKTLTGLALALSLALSPLATGCGPSVSTAAKKNVVLFVPADAPTVEPPPAPLLPVANGPTTTDSAAETARDVIEKLVKETGPITIPNDAK